MSVSLGVVGAGGIAGMHLQSIASIENASVIAITDTDLDACTRRQEEFEIPVVSPTIDALLEQNPDAILVCTPTFTHCDIVSQAAQAGKYIFCEKPMARTLPEAQRMIDSCDRHGASLMLGFVRRFCPEWNWFKTLVERGTIGRPVVWRVVYSSGGPASPWYLNREQGAGPFLDGMVHNYDFCRYAFGELQEVASTMVTLKPDSSAFDTGTAHMTFASGDQHVIIGSWGLPKGTHTPGIHDALGPEGALLFRDTGPSPEEIDTDTHGYLVSYGPDNERTVYPYLKEDMFLKEIQYFVDAVRQKTPPEPSGEDGYRALDMALRVLGEV